MCTYTYAIHAHNYSMHYSQCFQTQSLSLLHGRFMRHLSITEMPNTTCTHLRRSYVCVHTLGSIYKLGCVNFSLHQTIEGCLKGITIYYERSTHTHSHTTPSDKWIAVAYSMHSLPLLYNLRWLLWPCSCSCMPLQNYTNPILFMHAPSGRDGKSNRNGVALDAFNTP